MCMIFVFTDKDEAKAKRLEHGDNAKFCECDDVSIYRKIEDEEMKDILTYPDKVFVVIVC